MKVLHVLNGLHAAGIEALALQLIRHAPAGVAAELLNLDTSVRHLEPAFAPLLPLHHWRRCDRLQLAWRAFWLCRASRPDALLLYPCSRPLLWLALGARLAGVHRLAVALQNTAPSATLNPAARRRWLRLLRWFQRLGVEVVPCTEAVVASLAPLPRGLRLAAVIANGCDTAAIAAASASARASRPAHHFAHGPWRLLMVARLDPIKDQATLLRAFAAARQPGWQLWLVGEGPERPRLEQLARQLQLDPAEVLLGRRTDIPALLAQADLFAFSTTAAEGFGIALIEAMAAGLPLLASDVPACRQVLAAGAAGELLPPGDTAAWTRRLAALMADPHARAALAARAQRHAARFSIGPCAAAWYELLGWSPPVAP
ncbi:MAG: glycosyltransferase [Pirellulales bacterium]